MEHTKPIARTLPAADVAAFLRSLVGLVPADDESAVDASRPAPHAIDAKAWIAWVLGGLYACALPIDTEGENIDEAKRRPPWVPRVRVMVAEARRVAMVIARHRHGGNITHASEALGTSRRALREALKRAGAYQPPTLAGAASNSSKRRRRRSSRERAADVLAKLARGMSATSIATKRGPVRVHIASEVVRIEIEGEAPTEVGQHEAQLVLASVLERMGGPVRARGRKGDVDAT